MAAKWDGAHWIGTPSARLKEMNPGPRRRSAGSPPGRARPCRQASHHTRHPTTPRSSTCCTAHRRATTPSMARSLRRRGIHHQAAVPRRPDRRASVNRWPTQRPRRRRDTIRASAADIEASTDLSITEPLTQVVINAKRVKSDNGKLSFDDVEITMGDQDRLPPQLTAMQKSLTVDSDMLAVDDSGGVWNSGGTSTVSDTDRANVAQWLESHDLRMVPETVTFNSTPTRPGTPPVAVQGKAHPARSSSSRPRRRP